MDKIEETAGLPPICHFTPMNYEWADDAGTQVDWFECKHCGHTKDIHDSYHDDTLLQEKE